MAANKMAPLKECKPMEPMRRRNMRIVVVGVVLLIMALVFFAFMRSIASTSNDPVSLMQTVGAVTGVRDEDGLDQPAHGFAEDDIRRVKDRRRTGRGSSREIDKQDKANNKSQEPIKDFHSVLLCVSLYICELNRPCEIRGRARRGQWRECSQRYSRAR